MKPQDMKLILGVGLVALVGAAVLSSLRTDTIADKIAQARDSLFEVDPGCETIRFKGGGDAPDEEALAQARMYYFEPFVKAELTQGAEEEAQLIDMPLVDYLTTAVLYQLFPECQNRDPAPWPPASLIGGGSFSVIYVAMKLYIGGILADVLAERDGAPAES